MLLNTQTHSNPFNRNQTSNVGWVSDFCVTQQALRSSTTPLFEVPDGTTGGFGTKHTFWIRKKRYRPMRQACLRDPRFFTLPPNLNNRPYPQGKGLE